MAITTGRAPGDCGQPSHVGYCKDRSSRPDHIIPKLGLPVGGCTGSMDGRQKLKGTMCERQGCVTTNFSNGNMERLLLHAELSRVSEEKPLQFYWFRDTIKFFNSLLGSISETLRKVLKADLHLAHGEETCWSAH
eukprot:scaffold48937_cov17-Tisochrysis_lutea.AAC.1